MPGRIEVHERRAARVGASVTGRIHEVDVTVGRAVRRGERLASLTSTRLSAAQLDYLQAQSQLGLAERAAQRAGTLFRVADLSSVWLVADVPKQRGALLRPGQTIEAAAARPGKPVAGKVAFVAAAGGSASRSFADPSCRQ